MYSQNNVWLEKKNDVMFNFTAVGKSKIALRIEDKTFSGHLSMHIDRELIPRFVECLQQSASPVEDKKCETTG